MAKIAIILTVYKKEKFISEVIESVINQSFQDRELVIGDNSPDDKSWNILKKYVDQDQRIKARHHKQNKGILGNMNFLFEKINPETPYVTFLEGDDLYFLNNLQEKVDSLDDNSEIGIVYHDLCVVDHNLHVLKKSLYQDIPPFKDSRYYNVYHFLLYSQNIYGWTCALKYDLARQIFPLTNPKYNENYTVADFDFYVRALSIAKSLYINKPLLKYRIHGDNISGKKGRTDLDISILFDSYFRKNKIKKNKAIYSIIKAFFNEYDDIDLKYIFKILFIMLFSTFPKKIAYKLYILYYKNIYNLTDKDI